jgi:hypothetical protein
MATQATFTTPKTWQAQLTAANTARDGSGSTVTVAAGGTSGSRIDKVRVVAAGTTTAGMVRLFVYDGTNTRLVKEVPVSAVTPSSTVEVFSAERDFFGGLWLANGWSLKASTHNAETFNVIAHGGDA